MVGPQDRSDMHTIIVPYDNNSFECVRLPVVMMA
jgi:hypothetical protein